MKLVQDQICKSRIWELPKEASQNQSMSRHIRYFLHKELHMNLKRYIAGTLSVKES
jgi:hypothetical protein